MAVDSFLRGVVEKSVYNSKFTPGRTAPLRWVVIHDMEAPEGSSTAESVSAWSARELGIRSSWHVACDNDSSIQSVSAKNTAWHAPNANSGGFGIEQAGYARQSRSEWLDVYSLAVIDRTARVAAAVCVEYGIPVKHLSNDEIRAGHKGIISHRDVTNALNGGSGHFDPGPSYPWDVLLAKVAGYVAQINSGGIDTPVSPNITPPKPAAEVLRLGHYGPAVASLQTRLKAAGFNPGVIDGDFGPMTQAAVIAFQKRNGLNPDGEYGPLTRKALEAAGAKPPVDPKPKPVVPSPVTKLVVDGVLGPKTIKELQRQLKVTADGELGSQTAKALQKKLGVTVDGDIGPKTTKALQKFVGALQDGVWGRGTTAALQRALNVGRFK